MSPRFRALDTAQPPDEATDRAINLPTNTDRLRREMAVACGAIAQMMLTPAQVARVRVR